MLRVFKACNEEISYRFTADRNNRKFLATFFSHAKKKKDRQLRISHTINTTGLNKRADSFRVFCPFFVTIRDCGRKNSSEAYQCTLCQEGKHSSMSRT